MGRGKTRPELLDKAQALGFEDWADLAHARSHKLCKCGESLQSSKIWGLHSVGTEEACSACGIFWIACTCQKKTDSNGVRAQEVEEVSNGVPDPMVEDLSNICGDCGEKDDEDVHQLCTGAEITLIERRG